MKSVTKAKDLVYDYNQTKFWPQGSHKTKNGCTSVFSCLLQALAAVARRMNVSVHESQVFTQPCLWALHFVRIVDHEPKHRAQLLGGLYSL